MRTKTKNKKGVVFSFLAALLILVPVLTLAKVYPENDPSAKNLSKFTKGDAKLFVLQTKDFPPTIFSGPAYGPARYLSCQMNTDKKTYQVGEEVGFFLRASNLTIDAENQKRIKDLSDKLFYPIWSKGNFYVEVVRLSDQVEYGENIVASGLVFKEDNIQINNGEGKLFNFNWQIPKNAKAGNYEIRVYPTSDGIIFRGDPLFYHSPLKTSITVTNKDNQKEELEWDLSKIKVDGQSFKLKHGFPYLKAGESHSVSVPLKNQSGETKTVIIEKQMKGFPSLALGTLFDEEKEEITLNPKEEKIIQYDIKPEALAKDPFLSINIGFIDDQNFPQKTNYKFLADSPKGEWVFISTGSPGNVATAIAGLGTASPDTPFVPKDGAYLNYFLEIVRIDPLFFSTGDAQRGKDLNIKLNLKLTDQAGKTVDEIGYDGPSWDRSGQIYKTIKLDKSYSYLKLIGTLENQDGSIEKKEIEYNFSNANQKQPEASALEKTTKNFFSEKVLLLVLTGLLLIVIAAGIVLVVKKKK